MHWPTASQRRVCMIMIMDTGRLGLLPFGSPQHLLNKYMILLSRSLSLSFVLFLSLLFLLNFTFFLPSQISDWPGLKYHSLRQSFFLAALRQVYTTYVFTFYYFTMSFGIRFIGAAALLSGFAAALSPVAVSGTPTSATWEFYIYVIILPMLISTIHQQLQWFRVDFTNTSVVYADYK